MNGRSQLRTNIVSCMGSTLLSTVLMGLAYPLYLYFLGYEQYGLWIVLSTVLTLAQLGNFGISPALLKLVAEDYAAGDIDGIYRYIGCASLTLLASGSLLAAGVLLLRQPITSLFGITGPSVETACRLLPFIGLLSVYALIADAMNSVLAGLGRYDLVSYAQFAGQLITVVVAVGLLTLRYGIWSLLIANFASTVAMNLWSVVLIRRITGSSRWIRFRWDTERLRRLLGFGSWVFGASLVNAFIHPVNRIFITRFAGIAAVPVYDLSFMTSMKIRAFLESGFRSLAPEFSSLNAVDPQAAHAGLKSADRKGIRMVLYWGTLVYLPVLLFCGWGLRVWLRSRFTPELPGVFRLILLGSYLSLWGAQSWHSLLGFGRSPQILAATLLQAFANIGWIFVWPVLLHRSVTLAVITSGAAFGMLASTVYLRWHAARLKADLASRCDRLAREAIPRREISLAVAPDFSRN